MQFVGGWMLILEACHPLPGYPGKITGLPAPLISFTARLSDLAAIGKRSQVTDAQAMCLHKVRQKRHVLGRAKFCQFSRSDPPLSEQVTTSYPRKIGRHWLHGPERRDSVKRRWDFT